MKTHLRIAPSYLLRFSLLVLFFICQAFLCRAQNLTLADVQNIIAQTAAAASANNQKVTIAVTDHEGNVLGVFAMAGTNSSTVIRSVGTNGQGLEGLTVPASAAAVSKAGTAALLSSSGNAFTTRTASFIIQEHFPPGIDNRAGGPLYGVQFSSLSCSDVAVAGLPLGLSGDSGGVPLYRNGVAVGGLGVEGDGLYTVDRDPYDTDQPAEEIIAAAGSHGFEAPASIRADNILIDGIRLPFANVPDAAGTTIPPFSSLSGTTVSILRAAPASAFYPTGLGGVAGEMTTRFPIVAGTNLTAAEVTGILTQAAQTANMTRAGIRQPIGSNARISISVVDTNGNVLGIFRQQDAPVFGFDVAVQKARSAMFISQSNAGAELTAAGFGSYVTRAAADGINLNGATAFSERAFGFLHRPLYPDGINNTAPGPFSTALVDWSPFNVGLQLDLIKTALTSPAAMCSMAMVKKRVIFKPAACVCTVIPELKNGAQIFAGGIPIYRNGVLIGGVGVSGDGIDQDDFIAAGGAQNFAPPAAIRSDQVIVRGARLPFLKFPVRPTLKTAFGKIQSIF